MVIHNIFSPPCYIILNIIHHVKKTYQMIIIKHYENHSINKWSLLSDWTVDDAKSVWLMKPTYEHNTGIIWTPACLKKKQ